MAEHLSALVLDTLAAELPVDLVASSHLAACESCRARLEAVKAGRAALTQGPQFKALLGKLQTRVAPSVKFPRWVPPMLAIAAAMLVLVGTRFLPGASDNILKGAPTVELLKDGTTAVTVAHVGDKLSIAVGGAGQDAVAIFTLDDAGEVSSLLPSTPIAAGARVPVGQVFEVTAGSFAVFACFANAAVPVDALRTELGRRAAQSKTTPRQVTPPDGCARTMLEVLP